MDEAIRHRVNEFVQYHIHGDGECNGVLLKAYCDRNNFSAVDRFDVSYFYATTYCVASALYLLQKRDSLRTDPEETAKRVKQELIFQSDSRYCRLNGNFEKMIRCWAGVDAGDFSKETTTDGRYDMETAEKVMLDWWFFGRFRQYLFAETYAILMGLEMDSSPINWSDGDTATSGLMNIYGMDSEADEFDRTDRLPETVPAEKLDVLYGDLIDEIKAAGGDSRTACVETSLCAYRKFYKGTRYNGYYLDRQLEELNRLAGEREQMPIVMSLFSLRSQLFDKKYLGERSGWTGIRKSYKTLYQRKRIIS